MQIIFIAWVSIAIFMAFLWEYQRQRAEADIVDFGWTVSLAFLALLFSLTGNADLYVRAATSIFAAIWACRLGLHIWKRVQEPGEDQRYLALRESWGSKAQIKFFVFFQAQALLAIILSISFLIPATQVREISLSQLILACLWFLFSILGETFSDSQLKGWREDPANKGKSCRAGLWRYSRHPNYFFEWLYWFSYLILAYGSNFWYLTVVPPAIILFLILKVTGIPPTEERALKTRGDDYREYQRTTSAFVPWFPRGGKS